jgi:hypothetical protein
MPGPKPLTPADFLADVTEDDLLAMRREAREERPGGRVIEFTISRDADPKLHRGEVIHLQIPERSINARFTVVRVEPREYGVSYSIMAAPGDAKAGEKVLRILGGRLDGSKPSR